MTKKDKNPFSFMLKIFVFALVGGVVAIGFYWYKFCTFKECYVLPDIEKWGQTGDFFGGVLNPFFTLVGLFFVIVTIQQNQQALKQNEIELQLSREELKKSSEALQSQVITAEKQRFETTFFQLLSLFNGVVRDLKLNNEIYGRNSIGHLHENLQKCIRRKMALEIESINTAYGDFYNQYGYMLASYFRNLYSIIKFVDNSELSDEEKKFYTNLVRAQLSKFELGSLFYNCLLDENAKFLHLVKKYDLLECLEDTTLADPAHRALFNSVSAGSHVSEVVKEPLQVTRKLD